MGGWHCSPDTSSFERLFVLIFQALSRQFDLPSIRSTRGSTHGFQCTRDVRRDRLSWTWWTTVDPCYSPLLFPSFLLYQRGECGPSSRCKSRYSHFFRGATKPKGWPDPRSQQWWFLLVQSVVSKWLHLSAYECRVNRDERLEDFPRWLAFFPFVVIFSIKLQPS